MSRVQSFGEKWGFRRISSRPSRSAVRSSDEKLLLLQGLIAATSRGAAATPVNLAERMGFPSESRRHSKNIGKQSIFEKPGEGL